jgi:dTDP-glucose 4,6-dehydratase
MVILLTGGMGFIGSTVVRYLLASTDATVVNIDKLTYAASPESLGDWLKCDELGCFPYPTHRHCP